MLVTCDPAVGLVDEHVAVLEAWANVNPGIEGVGSAGVRAPIGHLTTA